MNGWRMMVAGLACLIAGFGQPYREPWERGCLAVAVALLCVLVLVGPAREKPRESPRCSFCGGSFGAHAVGCEIADVARPVTRRPR